MKQAGAYLRKSTKEDNRQVESFEGQRREIERFAEANSFEIVKWYKEAYSDRVPANEKPRSEPRRKWPRSSLCAVPWAEVKGRRGVRLQVKVSYLEGRDTAQGYDGMTRWGKEQADGRLTNGYSCALIPLKRVPWPPGVLVLLVGSVLASG